MRRATKSFLATVLMGALSGCGGSSQSSSEAPSETQRPELTAEACQASGGAVVGDIGDGAIHRADYRCPSGSKPSGSIRASQGGPTAVEGAVCCPK